MPQPKITNAMELARRDMVTRFTMDIHLNYLL